MRICTGARCYTVAVTSSIEYETVLGWDHITDAAEFLRSEWNRGINNYMMTVTGRFN